MNWPERTRRLAQIGFAGFVVYTSLVHKLSTVDGVTAPIDAPRPFGPGKGLTVMCCRRRLWHSGRNHIAA